MKVIGIVGGMGAGKTTVVSLIQELMKAFIIPCDQIGHEILLKGHKGYQAVVQEFGQGILSDDGEIIRSRLGAIVFGNKEKLKTLNRITHPLIYQEAERRIQDCKKENFAELIIIDAALLIEMGLVPLTDKVVAVYATDEIRVERIIKRQGLTRSEVLERFKAQKNWEEFKEIAQEVIDTSLSLEYTKEQIEKLIVRL